MYRDIDRNKVSFKEVLILAIIMVVVMGMIMTCKAADRTAQVTLSWDGKNNAGAIEASLPVTITVYNAGNDAVFSTANVSGPVTAFSMPTFTVPVPDNGTTTFRVYAKARDSAGNTSAASAISSVTIQGADTIAPGVPQITITIGG